MTAETTADETPPPIAATTAARLLSLFIVLVTFVVAFGPARRAAQRSGARLGVRTPVYFHRILCLGLGIKVRRHGTFSSAPKQLIVANHISGLDMPVLGSLGPLSFVSKKEIDNPQEPPRVRLRRELVALQDVVYIDRRRRFGAPAVNARMVEVMRTGAPVVLFAEAAMGDGNRLQRLRSSHFEAARLAACSDNEGASVIQPVYLHYSSIAGLPTTRWQRPRIAWYGEMPFLPHFLQYARSGGVTCDVYCGAPIRVLPDMDRKSATRLTEAALRELAAKAPLGKAAVASGGRQNLAAGAGRRRW